MSTHCGYEVPMFYKGRVFHRALRAFHGPRIYLPGNNGYPVARWVERQLGYEDSPPREGFNVLHLLIDLARNLGCDPIIFVGMDLAFTGLQSYASAVEQSSAVNEAEITGGKDLNNNAFLREGVDGRPVYTLWKWVGESNYTSKYALQHPETTFINATEGGLGVPGVPNQSLREVADRYLQKTWDLQAWVHAELQSHPLKLDQAKPLSGILEDLKESLERCLAQLEDMIEASQVLVDAVTEGLQAQIQAQSELIAEGQEALSKEEAYTWILDPLNEVRSLVFERGWKEIERATHFSGEKERVQAFFKAQAQELSCLHEACRLNLHILQRSLEGFEAGTVLQAEAPPPQLMDSPGLQGSELLTFWGDGHVAGKSQWKSAQRHGESELYYPDGTVYARLHFAEGVPDGWQRYFYADGSLKTEVFYKRGRVSGQVRLFFPNGQEKKHIDYQDGVIHGWQREWDRQGRQVMEQHFCQGRLLEERYWVDGVLVEEKTYHSEVPVADTRKWDQRGVLRVEETFEGTRFVHREWGEDGSLEREFGGFWQGGQSTIDRLVCGQLYPGERARYQP
jgi:antitoxin component YwqK of YwqJK toxin-antitoxin module/flagellar motor protein MotB